MTMIVGMAYGCLSAHAKTGSLVTKQLFVGTDIRKSRTHRISYLRATERRGFWARTAASPMWLRKSFRDAPFLVG
jgi:hypothetical protein